MINFYYHGGSANHGCEAIVRSSVKLVNESVTLWSTNPESDSRYGIDSIAMVKNDTVNSMSSAESLQFKVHHKLTGTDFLYTKFTHKAFFAAVNPNDLYFSIGGDNYCYAGKDIIGHYNRLIHDHGAKTVFWGCSFEAKDMDDATAKDIAMYDLITARETLSYETLKAVNPNTVLVADPAFTLDKTELPLPDGWIEGNTIGVNASPLILQSAKDGGLALDAYRCLIRRILKNTDAVIALVPHVVILGNDDREPLNKLFEEFKDTGRVIMIEDHNCCELKGYISRCRMFIGARTHATIAAYSTCVPTLVLGYSVKSKGIAKDIFGTDENYVLPVQNIQDPEELADGFDWLLTNETSIHNNLIETMPDYISRAKLAADAVSKLK